MTIDPQNFICIERAPLSLLVSSYIHPLLSCNTGKIWGCCPGTWKPFSSSCYFISSKENFWAKSEQNCVGMGAHLVVINTEAEQVLLFSLFFIKIKKK